MARVFEELAQCVGLRSYKERQYSVLASYMDETFDMKGKGVFVVGGIMGRGVETFDLDIRWERLCKRSDIDIAYFKASDCELGVGEFAKFVKTPRCPTPEEKQLLSSISHEFIKVISSERQVIVQGIAVVQEDFYEAIKDSRARAILGDTPYFLTYHLAMIQCAWAAKELERQKMEEAKPWQKVERDYVSFVCDENSNYHELASKAYHKLKEANPSAAEYMATYSEADDKKVYIVQAADASAYEIRRAMHVSLNQWRDELRAQFRILSDAHIVYLIQHVAKKQLDAIVRTHEPGEAFKLDEIMGQVFHEDIKIRGADDKEI